MCPSPMSLSRQVTRTCSARCYYEGNEFSFSSPNPTTERRVGSHCLLKAQCSSRSMWRQTPMSPLPSRWKMSPLIQGANCGTSCTKTPTIFNNGAMQGPSIDSCDDPLASYTDYKFVLDADDTGGDMVIIPARPLRSARPVRFRAREVHCAQRGGHGGRTSAGL
jgi:hypothetical protein